MTTTRRSARISARSANRRAQIGESDVALFSPYHEHNTRLSERLRKVAEVEIGNVVPSPYEAIRKVLDFDDADDADDDDEYEGMHQVAAQFLMAWAYVLSFFEPLRKKGYFDKKKWQQYLRRQYHVLRLWVYDSAPATWLRDDENFHTAENGCYLVLVLLLIILLWPYLPGLPALSLPSFSLPSLSPSSSTPTTQLEEVSISEQQPGSIDTTAFDELRASLLTLNKNFQTLAKGYDELVAKNQRLEAASADLKAKLDSQAQELSTNSETHRTQLDSNVESLRAKFEQDISQVQASLNEMASTSRGENEAVGAKLSEVRKEVGTVENKVSELASSTEGASEKNAEAHDQIEEKVSLLRDSLTTAKEVLASATSKVASDLEKAVADWKARAGTSANSGESDTPTGSGHVSEEVSARLVTLEESLTSLQQVQENAASQLTTVADKEDEFSAKLEKLADLIALKPDRESFDSVIGDLQNEIKTVTTSIAEKAASSEPSAQGSGAGSDSILSAKIQEDLNSLQDRISSLEGVSETLQTLSSEVDTLKGLCDNLRSELDSIREDASKSTTAGENNSDSEGQTGAAIDGLRDQLAELDTSTKTALTELRAELLKEVEQQATTAALAAAESGSGTGGNGGGGAGLSAKAVQALIDKALDLYSADRIGIADYALKSAGASVVTSHTTPSLGASSSPLANVLPLQRLFNRLPHLDPAVALSSDVSVGNCWAFDGAKGYLTILLSDTIRVSGVSIDHIPSSISRHMESAPRKFKIRAFSDVASLDVPRAGRDLGEFEFKLKGRAVQTFATALDTGNTNVIRLEFQSNYGHSYTCVYRVRVHGDPDTAQ